MRHIKHTTSKIGKHTAMCVHGSWHVVGKGHSWGSFKSKAAVKDWIDKVEADDEAYRLKHSELYRKMKGLA